MSSDLNTEQLKVDLWQNACLNFCMLFCKILKDKPPVSIMNRDFFTLTCSIFFRTSIYATQILSLSGSVRVKKTRDFASFFLSGFDFLQINLCPFTININNFKQLELFQDRLNKIKLLFEAHILSLYTDPV